jgi:hypothetical protein
MITGAIAIDATAGTITGVIGTAVTTANVTAIAIRNIRFNILTGGGNE